MGAAVGDAPNDVIWMVLGCDVIMIVCGAVSASIGERDLRLMFVWFFVASLFYVVMLFTIQAHVADGPSMADRPVEVQELFSRLKRSLPLDNNAGGAALLTALNECNLTELVCPAAVLSSATIPTCCPQDILICFIGL